MPAECKRFIRPFEKNTCVQGLVCSQLARPAIAEQRLSLANNGNIIVGLKTAYDDGTTHVVLTPIEFIGRLTALVRSRPHPDRGST